MLTTIAEYNKKEDAFPNDWDEWETLFHQMQYREENAGKLYQNVHVSMERMMEKILAGCENKVFSPVALYMALSLLAETTEGKTREQILKALEVEDNKLTDTFNALEAAASADSSIATSRISSSLWVNENLHFDKEKFRELCETYRASAYSGEMGHKEINAAISEWVNKTTGNLLKKNVNIKTTPDTFLEMLTTLYFCSKWDYEFDKRDTKSGTFYLSDGTETKCRFMHQEIRTSYHRGDRFTAISKALNAGYSGMFILPNTGIKIDELFSDNQFKELVATGSINTSKEYLVKLKMPKFDISSKLNLINDLKKLGIEDVFDMTLADFSPISNEEELYLSKVEQTTRFKVNEEGVEAASCVEMGIACGCIPPKVDEVEFVLDRPFIFMVVAMDTVTVFAGKVMNPAE